MACRGPAHANRLDSVCCTERDIDLSGDRVSVISEPGVKCGCFCHQVLNPFQVLEKPPRHLARARAKVEPDRAADHAGAEGGDRVDIAANVERRGKHVAKPAVELEKVEHDTDRVHRWSEGEAAGESTAWVRSLGEDPKKKRSPNPMQFDHVG